MSVAAAGLLLGVQRATGDLSTWRDASQGFVAPTGAAVLVAVARAQPQLHAQVVAGFRVGRSHAEYRRRQASWQPDLSMPVPAASWTLRSG